MVVVNQVKSFGVLSISILLHFGQFEDCISHKDNSGGGGGGGGGGVGIHKVLGIVTTPINHKFPSTNQWVKVVFSSTDTNDENDVNNNEDNEDSEKTGTVNNKEEDNGGNDDNFNEDDPELQLIDIVCECIIQIPTTVIGKVYLDASLTYHLPLQFFLLKPTLVCCFLLGATLQNSIQSIQDQYVFNFTLISNSNHYKTIRDP
ncbi:hypothetical protein ACTA71_001077 [Dictyostelium dimigraforme]